MDGQGDDHGPGQGEGRSGEGGPPGAVGKAKSKSAGDIDKNAKRVEEEVGKGDDNAKPADQGESGESKDGASDGQSLVVQMDQGRSLHKGGRSLNLVTDH